MKRCDVIYKAVSLRNRFFFLFLYGSIKSNVNTVSNAADVNTVSNAADVNTVSNAADVNSV